MPIYTYGITLDGFADKASVYRDAKRLREIYGRLPKGTVNLRADYMDQTDVYRLQQRAIKRGKKYIVLVVFDGMDWQTTWAAAVYRSGRVNYREGRGTGLHIQDYCGAESDYGYFVSSPHNSGTTTDVDAQTVSNQGGTAQGGFDVTLGSEAPWFKPRDPTYFTGKNRQRPHVVTDSASSATAMTSGIKTYNGAINVDANGKQVVPIARQLQQEESWSVGIVTNVPISHATPASAYANNVHRNDYQDLTRDLLGLPSIAHRNAPLSGVNVLLGCGWGEVSDLAKGQGANYAPGNKYLSASDLSAIDVRNGGRYEVVLRTSERTGRKVLLQATQRAVKQNRRLFGFFGVAPGHLPFQTADGEYDPTVDAKKLEEYSAADIDENPTLADMTRAALSVLEGNKNGFWLMVEAGDVDWANHANNIDNSIGAVLSGDDAFREVTRWVEAKRAWNETAVIITADHGHLLELVDPEKLTEKIGSATNPDR